MRTAMVLYMATMECLGIRATAQDSHMPRRFAQVCPKIGAPEVSRPATQGDLKP